MTSTSESNTKTSQIPSDKKSTEGERTKFIAAAITEIMTKGDIDRSSASESNKITPSKHSNPEHKKGHFQQIPGHPMPHRLTPSHAHPHYYPYPGMPLPPHYDPAYAVPSAASPSSDTTGHNETSQSKTIYACSTPPDVKGSGGSGGPSSGSPSKSGSSAIPSFRDPNYPPHPPPHYMGQYPLPHPHAAAAYHRWAEAAAAVGYPPHPHRYHTHYDPYGVPAAAYGASPPGNAPEQPPHGHTPTGPYRFSDPTLRRDALSRNSGSPEKKTGTPVASPSKASDTASASNDGNSSHPNAAYILEMEARAEGATSPSQIEEFHRVEVTSMGCTCKKTKCLKLYCQCFGVKIYCGLHCRCLTCHNLPQYDHERETSIRIILTRNPNAFETKFEKNLSVPLGDPAAMAAIRQQDESSRQPGALPMPARILSHKLGCKCRKSACTKKYCECYAGNVKCSANCRCVGCKNVQLGGLQDDKPPQPSVTVFNKDGASRDAAYSLAFLKHGSSAEKPVRAISSDKSESGSMPSLGSEESPTECKGTRTGAEGGKVVPPNTSLVGSLHSSEKTAVSALLMAARAMAETSSSPATTPPTKINNESEGTSDGHNYSTPQRNLLVRFTSPKRKALEASTGQGDEPIRCVKKELPEENRTNKGTGFSQHSANETHDVKRSRIGSVRKSDEGKSMSQNGGGAIEMTTPAKGTTYVQADLTPVSARCIDFKNLSVDDPTGSIA